MFHYCIVKNTHNNDNIYCQSYHQTTYDEPPAIDTPVETIKVFVIEVLSAYNASQQFFVKYLPASSVRHPTNYMSVLWIANDCMKFDWKSYLTFLLRVGVPRRIGRKQFRKFTGRVIIVSMVDLRAFGKALLPLLVFSALIHCPYNIYNFAHPHRPDHAEALTVDSA